MHVSPPARPGSVRRAPRYRPFAVTGAVLGVVVAIVAVQFATPTPTISRPQLCVYLVPLFAGLGVLLALLWAVLIERRQ